MDKSLVNEEKWIQKLGIEHVSVTYTVFFLQLVYYIYIILVVSLYFSSFTCGKRY